VDRGEAAVLSRTEPADPRPHVEAELVMGQGEVGLGLGPMRAEEAGTLGIGTASDGEREPDDAIEGGDGAEVVIIGMEAVATFGSA
jgi:hypothetical protein